MRTSDQFQNDAIEAGVRALLGGQDFLLVAPTGSGKTGMGARICKKVHERTGVRVLNLVHRRNLFTQMAGDPKEKDAAQQLGEVGSWLGEKVGRYSDSMVDEEPWFVVGMVQTLMNRIAAGEEIGHYDVINIDEAHHAYGEGAGADNDAVSAYGVVIQHLCSRNPATRVFGMTATDFRSDPNEKLDPRLEAAVRHVVTFEEALAAGRIVEPNTIRPPIRHRNGKTVEEMADELVAKGGHKRLAEEIGPMLARERPEDFWDQSVAAWLKEAPGKKTIAFTDSVEELELLAAAFERAAKADPAAAAAIGRVDLVGNQRSDKENDAALAGYGHGDTRILISCKMIGEGYNVPGTECVLMTNRCTTRAWYQQMKGRAMRAQEGKPWALCLDMGATSYVFGALEQQIELQAVEHMLDIARDPMAQAAAIARIWHNAGDDDPNLRGWMVLPSEKKTRFLRRTPTGEFRIYTVEHGTQRANAKNGATSQLKATPSPEGKSAWKIDEIAALTAEDLDRDRGWHAIMRSRSGEDGSVWHDRARAEIASYREPLAMIVRHEAPARAKMLATRPMDAHAVQQAAQRDEKVGEHVRAALGGEAGPLHEAVDYIEFLFSKNANRAGAREVLLLSALALREIGRAREGWPRALCHAAQGGASVILDDHGREGIRQLAPNRIAELLGGAGRVLGMVADQTARAGRSDHADALRRLGTLTRKAGEVMTMHTADEAARVA